jgi:hypothetical protein
MAKLLARAAPDVEAMLPCTWEVFHALFVLAVLIAVRHTMQVL